jgi:hypothetical protein
MGQMSSSVLRQLVSWLGRVLKKGLWLLGLLPTLVDYIVTYFPQADIPAPIRSLTEKGGDIHLTLVLVSVGLVISAFLVHRETASVAAKLDQELSSIREAKPKIIVGFGDSEDSFTSPLTLHVQHLPEPPDYSQLVDDKRQELLPLPPPPAVSEYSRLLGQMAARMASPLEEPNPMFETELESFLDKYREFLVVKFEIDLDRAFKLAPVVVNRGGAPASDITVRFLLPSLLAPLRPHERYIPEEDPSGFRRTLLLRPPHPPSPTRSRFLDPMRVISADLGRPQLPDSSAAQSLDAPSWELDGETWRVTYKIPKLVPHLLYNDLTPFHLWLGRIHSTNEFDIHVEIFSAELSSPSQQVITLQVLVE